MQRLTFAFKRSTLWFERDQPATNAAGFKYHAGQGKSCYPRSCKSDLLQRDRQRPYRYICSRGRPTTVERNGTCNSTFYNFINTHVVARHDTPTCIVR